MPCCRVFLFAYLSSSLSSTGSSIISGEERPWWVSTDRARARGREGVPRAWDMKYRASEGWQREGEDVLNDEELVRCWREGGTNEESGCSGKMI